MWLCPSDSKVRRARFRYKSRWGVLLLYMNLSSLVGFHQSPCRTSDSGKFFLRSYHVRVKLQVVPCEQSSFSMKRVFFTADMPNCRSRTSGCRKNLPDHSPKGFNEREIKNGTTMNMVKVFIKGQEDKELRRLRKMSRL